MPTFVMIARDVPDSVALRDKFREQHVDRVTKLHEQGRIVLAGPIKSDDEATSIGAMIAFKADNLEEAKAFVAADPYVTGGVFQTVTVQPFRQVFPEPT